MLNFHTLHQTYTSPATFHCLLVSVADSLSQQKSINIAKVFAVTESYGRRIRSILRSWHWTSIAEKVWSVARRNDWRRGQYAPKNRPRTQCLAEFKAKSMRLNDIKISHEWPLKIEQWNVFLWVLKCRRLHHFCWVWFDSRVLKIYCPFFSWDGSVIKRCTYMLGWSGKYKFPKIYVPICKKVAIKSRKWSEICKKTRKRIQCTILGFKQSNLWIYSDLVENYL